jgi:glucokinase
VRAVGIGFGGPVDDAARCVIKSHQIAGWDGFPLAEWLSELLGVPAALGNDADVAGLAEALFGASRGFSPVFYITLGSGIGGGLVVDGTIYRGGGRGAAEIGHLRMPTATGHRPLEEVASGWGLQEAVRRRLAGGASSAALLALAGGQADQVTAQHLAQAAEGGDPLALAVVESGLTYLAEAICHVIALLAPRRIVVGGGVSLMGEGLLFAPLRRLVAERVFRPFADAYEIVPAALGEEVVVHGALALARKAFPD